MLKSELRAEEFRVRAEAAAAEAATATLENIRARHLEAATIWAGLAQAERARTDKALAAIASARKKQPAGSCCEPQAGSQATHPGGGEAALGPAD